MEISSNQALEALEEVQDAQRRVATLRGYGYAAPYFLLWGCIWIVGFLGQYFLPAWAGRGWAALDLAGFAATVLLMRHQRSVAQRSLGARSSSRTFWRILALLATAMGFLYATYAVFQPQRSAQFAVFPALLCGAIYIGIGLWRGLRWLVGGLALAALALLGYYLLPQYMMLWMAAAGGGTLLITGFWLRRG
ncbi:MAG TPA: hypothetical protein VID71_00625 [Steroidobacteraceae bacterium]|jgi:hypothetical protein